MRAGRGLARWLPLGSVLATGFGLGWLLWHTCCDEVASGYAPPFSQASWITTAEARPQGYFRRELYLPEALSHAWMTVAAPDAFVLYVNGKIVDARQYTSLTLAGMYDIGPYLRPGKNVLGVMVRRRSYPGAAMVAVEGGYEDAAGQRHTFVSDASWQGATTEQSQDGGTLPWYGAAFDATAWQKVRLQGRPQAAALSPLDTHPLAWTLPPQGHWLEHRALPERMVLSRLLPLPAAAQEAWLRIATSRPYRLFVNGMAIDGRMPRQPLAADTAFLRLAGETWWQPERYTDVYRLTPFLRPGMNTLKIAVPASGSEAPGLFADGFVSSAGRVMPLRSDASWQVDEVAGKPSETITLTSSPRTGMPLKRLMVPVPPWEYRAWRLGQRCGVMSLTAALVWAIWQGMACLFRLLRRSTLRAAQHAMALAHLPVLVCLGSLFLVRFDVRVDPSWPFRAQVVGLCLALLPGCQAAILLEAAVCRAGSRPAQRRRWQHVLYALIFLGLLLAGALWRFHDLDVQSLYHDEVHMVTFVQGLFHKGYPYKMVGPLERPLATYELLPYPIALAAWLVGVHDFALRLPAACFGVLTLALLYCIGKRLFCAEAGLLAAALYAFCPQALIWSQYLWHPQQTQFCALLTSYLWYRAIHLQPRQPVLLYGAAGASLGTYLSWEGSGFLLPALGIGLWMASRNGMSWWREKHLWSALALLAAGVLWQLGRRQLLQVSYMVVGTGLSDVSLPSFHFFDPLYDPTYYVRNFLWLDNNAVLTIVALCALPVLRYHAGLAYYWSVPVAVLAMMTNLLPHPAIRYVYYLQPFVILSAAGVTGIFLQHIRAMARRSRVRLLRGMVTLVSLTIGTGLMVSSSAWAKLYRINAFAQPVGLHVRPATYDVDYRDSAHYLKAHYQDGDLVISVVPDTLAYYAGIRSDFFVEAYPMRQALYDPSQASPRYLERIAGVPVLRNLQELAEALHQQRRTWIVAAPYGRFVFMVREEMFAYVRQRARVVYESYDARIYLLES